jgi:exopolysaccharide biosynthesis protein
MANRYPGAIVAFNGDFFSPDYAFGAMGLAVKNGQRLDGNENDREGRELRRSSLSISLDGDIRIGPISRNLLPDPDESWNWVPDPELFYNSIGGLPLLVEAGHPVDLHEQCMQEQGWCPDQYYPRARTAFGKAFNGDAIIVIVPEVNGLTIEGLAHLMVELGSEEAINLDGGGSSQLWYDGSYLYYSSRAVAEGVIVFSDPIEKSGEDPGIRR